MAVKRRRIDRKNDLNIEGLSQKPVSTKPKGKKIFKFHLPPTMKDMLTRKVVEDGYGLKGKTRWIMEAVLDLLNDQSWKDQVLDGDIASGNDAQDAVYRTPEEERIFMKAHRDVIEYATDMAERDEFQRLEDISVRTTSQAAIVRAAITRRLTGFKMTTYDEPELPLSEG